MKKWISGLILALGLCTSFTANKVEAYGYDCCYDYCDDFCCEGPLCAGSFGLQIKGGWAPTHFNHRGRIWLTNPAVFPPVYSNGRVPSFNSLFDTPWMVGAELSYNFSDHAQLFLEFDWFHADGKHRHLDGGPYTFHQRFDDYKAWAGYLGARYFFCEWFCGLSPFIGFKAGFIDHHRVHARVTGPFGFEERFNYHRNQCGPSVGAQIGLNYKFCDNWNAVLTLEAVASHGFRGNDNNEIDAPLVGGITNVSIGDTGYLVSFPITLGVRYDF